MQEPCPGLAGTAQRRSLLTLMWSVFLQPLAAPAAGPEPLQLERVSRHVWRVAAARGEPGPGNGGRVSQLVVVEDGPRLWLLGAGPTPAFGRQLDALLHQQFGRGATDLVITRASPTLALGSAGMAAERAWALDDVARAMAQRCTPCLQHLRQQLGGVDESLHPALIRIPTQWLHLNAGAFARLGPFTAWALPRAAGDRALVLRHAEDRVMVAQGLLWIAGVPDLRDTDSSMMLASLQRLRRLSAACQVLGEQGDVGRVRDIDRHLDYLAHLHQTIDCAQAQGRNEAEPAMLWPGFTPQGEDARLHAMNWQRVWREREALSLR